MLSGSPSGAGVTGRKPQFPLGGGPEAVVILIIVIQNLVLTPTHQQAIGRVFVLVRQTVVTGYSRP